MNILQSSRMFIVPPSLENILQRNYKSSEGVAIICFMKVYKGVKNSSANVARLAIYSVETLQSRHIKWPFVLKQTYLARLRFLVFWPLAKLEKKGCRHWWPTSGIPAKEKELSWHERDKNWFARNWREKNFFVLPRVCLVRPLNTEMQPLSALYFSQTSEMAALYMPNVLVT